MFIYFQVNKARQHLAIKDKNEKKLINDVEILKEINNSKEKKIGNKDMNVLKTEGDTTEESEDGTGGKKEEKKKNKKKNKKNNRRRD